MDELYELKICYDDASFTSEHDGINLEGIKKICKAFEEKKVFWLTGIKKTVGIDFSKVSAIFYGVEKNDTTT